ncbi:MAG: ribosome-associated translation inhibitor RaiA [Firmicutes bacterium]|nr:ribosome-associated translation inhibitor RaiA [Bacillota bacterium]
MIIEIVSKNYNISDRLKNLIEKKLEKLDRYFEEDTKVKIMLKAIQVYQNTELFSLELSIAAGKDIMRVEVSDKDMFATIDLAIPKLEKQIIKHRKKVASKFKKFREKVISEQEVSEAEEIRAVVRSKTYGLVPMTVEDAIEEQELIGHSFYVFLNKTTNAVNVLYKRNDGDYGLIETIV